MRRAATRADFNRFAALAVTLLVGALLVTAFPPLASAADRTRPVLSRVYMTRSYFSPNGDGSADTSGVRFTVSERGRVTVRILSPITGAILRRLVSTKAIAAGTNSVYWDGKDDSGNILPDGRYTVRIYVVDAAGNKCRYYPWSVAVYIDTVRPTFSAMWVTPSPFSPNRRPDRYKDWTGVYMKLSERGYTDTTIWGNGHARRWRSSPRPSGRSRIVWNGRDSSGAWCDDGSYKVVVAYRDRAGNIATVSRRATSVILDTTAPLPSGWRTVPSTPYVQDGENDTAVMTFRLSERAAVTYSISNSFGVRLRRGRLWRSAGAEKLAWDAKQAVSGTTVVVPNGRYPMRMSFTDAAGNRRWLTKYFIVRSYYLVCIDPGHGGKNGVYDSGAVGPTGLRESVVNFDIAYNRLRPLLYAVPASSVGGYPIKVLMTRTRERAPWMTLGARSTLANVRGANIFISIHCNAAGITFAQGTETFHHEGSEQSRRLAVLVQRKVLALTRRRDRGIKTASFYVLRRARMPAALHECAFISNRTEERLLKSSSFRQLEALGMRDGIVAYFRENP